MKILALVTLACLTILASCGNKGYDETVVTSNAAASVSTMDGSPSTVSGSQAKINEIDGGMATLQAHHAEDSVKMDRLIGECQAETGAVMQGEGAMRIVNCVNGKW